MTTAVTDATPEVAKPGVLRRGLKLSDPGSALGDRHR
jgi:hypothetical protein